MYNGIGFNDTAFRVGQSEGVYQTYKLALYIYSAELLGPKVPLSGVLAELMRLEAPNGGFYTGYDNVILEDDAILLGNININSTNTETTCLAIMALELASPPPATQPQLPLWAYATMAVLLIVGLVLGYTIKHLAIEGPGNG